MSAEDASKPTSSAAPPAGKFINPVRGMAVSMAAKMHSEQYAGMSYYFRCDGCRTTFLQASAKYAAIYRAAMGEVAA
ncbi:MAG: YHS domain-containing protein [Betaproteobacteria bacterium]